MIIIFILSLQGKAYTSIEPGTDLNDMCVVPGSGLLFMANEAPKMLSYYIPVSMLGGKLLPARSGGLFLHVTHQGT